MMAQFVITKKKAGCNQSLTARSEVIFTSDLVILDQLYTQTTSKLDY